MKASRVAQREQFDWRSEHKRTDNEHDYCTSLVVAVVVNVHNGLRDETSMSAEAQADYL